MSIGVVTSKNKIVIPGLTRNPGFWSVTPEILACERIGDFDENRSV
jgi:hypothetical protein